MRKTAERHNTRKYVFVETIEQVVTLRERSFNSSCRAPAGVDCSPVLGAGKKQVLTKQSPSNRSDASSNATDSSSVLSSSDQSSQQQQQSWQRQIARGQNNSAKKTLRQQRREQRRRERSERERQMEEARRDQENTSPFEAKFARLTAFVASPSATGTDQACFVGCANVPLHMFASVSATTVPRAYRVRFPLEETFMPGYFAVTVRCRVLPSATAPYVRLLSGASSFATRLSGGLPVPQRNKTKQLLQRRRLNSMVDHVGGPPTDKDLSDLDDDADMDDDGSSNSVGIGNVKPCVPTTTRSRNGESSSGLSSLVSVQVQTATSSSNDLDDSKKGSLASMATSVSVACGTTMSMSELHAASERVDSLTASLQALESQRTKELERVGSLVSDLESERSQLRKRLERQQELSEEQLRQAYEERREMFDALRRDNGRLLSEIEDLRGHVRVVVRIRPPIRADELPGNTKNKVVVHPIDDKVLALAPQRKHKASGQLAPQREFTFTQVHGTEATQQEVFEPLRRLAQTVLQGRHVAVLAFGQTGSGKTWTMAGGAEPRNHGLRPRFVRELWRLIQEQRRLGAPFRFDVSVQLFEVYQEKLRDLSDIEDINDTESTCTDINSDSASGSGKGNNKSDRLRIVMGDDGIVHVHGSRDVPETEQATSMNGHSSRSHLVCFINVKRVSHDDSRVTVGKLALVDLAGSECVKRSGAHQYTISVYVNPLVYMTCPNRQRLREAQSINKSLLALGNVLTSLARKETHVPYRTSLLTRLLEDTLGSNARTVMLVTVAPTRSDYSETASALEYGAIARRVCNGNSSVAAESHQVRRLKQQVRILQTQLRRAKLELEDHKKN
ncbi:MAG: hypothetical protein MHM6MM_000586 [Cercozoa sp. M6MM]